MNSIIPTDLLELNTRFETWRTNRKYAREPIPNDLWNAAADFCRRYPPVITQPTTAEERAARECAPAARLRGTV
jgi:hypothetical protein